MVEYPMVVYDAPIWTVYMHVNKINGKKYVGITSKDPEKRWQNGLGYQPPKGKHNVFFDAIQKYGWEGFDHVTLINNITMRQADIMERVLIKYYHSHVSTNMGYNSNWGGFHGLLGLNGSDNPNAKKVICLSTGLLYGSLIEAREKTGISSGRIGSVCRGDQQYTYDKDRNPVIFAFYDDYIKMSQKEIDAKLKNIRSVIKPVICINNGTVFDTPYAAASITNTKYDKIVRSCKAKIKDDKEKRFFCGRDINTGEWLSWMFLDDYNNLTQFQKDDLLNKVKERSHMRDVRLTPLICLNTMESFDSVKNAADTIGIKSPSNISVECGKNVVGKCGHHPITNEPLYWIKQSDYNKLSNVDVVKLKQLYFTGNLLNKQKEECL